MERVGDRYEKLEGNCSTGQSPQWAVVPMEEEEEEKEKKRSGRKGIKVILIIIIIILGDKCRSLSSCGFLHSPATSSPLGPNNTTPRLPNFVLLTNVTTF
jgi:flagellar basal body-associated protein FliL